MMAVRQPGFGEVVSRNARGIGLACLLMAVGLIVHLSVPLVGTPGTNEDIFFIYEDARRLSEGQNPYLRILGSDMLTNEKYPTYLPLFYELGAWVRHLGFRTFDEWLGFWQPVLLAFHIGVAGLLVVRLAGSGMWMLAIFAGFVWLFSRWPMQVIGVAQIDGIAIFFLVASLIVLDRSRLWAFVLFGISLAVKQIALFVLPLYLIWAVERDDGSGRPGRVGAAAFALAAICVVPLFVSLPFLIDDPEAFVRSVIFSATRNPDSHFGMPSVDAAAGWVGLAAKLPMLALMLLVYAAAMRRQLGRYTAAALVIFTFLSFNSVLFRQYLAWIVPLVVLIPLDQLSASRVPENKS